MPRVTPRHRARILIVEDDRLIREALADLLADEDYEVVEAANGERARAICLSSALPDIILLDLLMPVMDGWEFAAWKAGEPRLARIPICVMTACGPRVPIPKEAAALVGKPIELEVLLEAIRRLC
jgi:CheY-like chemotaxis protein